MKRKNKSYLYVICVFCIFMIIFISYRIATKNKIIKNVKIGIIDSYISNKTLNNQNITNINFTDCNDESKNNHGKITLQTIKNQCNNCEIYYASVLDANNISSIEIVTDALEWCIQNNVDIICMSFATTVDDDKLRSTIERALNRNILIMSACINLSDVDCYPAMYKGVISVSEGMNPKATIIMKNREFSVNIDGKIIKKTGTSVSNAYICGYIAKELSQGNDDLQNIVDKIKKKQKI